MGDIPFHTISTTWGFLNPDSSTIRLPSAYDSLLSTAKILGQLLKSKKLRPLFDNASVIAVPPDLTRSQSRQLWMVYSMISSAYIFSIHEETQKHIIPRSLAVPLFDLASRLGFPSILNYDAYVYSNFRLNGKTADPTLPESYTPLLTFSSPSCDEHEGEKWFIVIHVATERIIGPLMPRLLNTLNHLECGRDSDSVVSFLDELVEALARMASTISRMRERLSPRSYAFTTRRYVLPFQGVRLDGVSELRGETGGQSPFPRAIGAFLGLQHESQDMVELGKHMLREHQEFVAEISRHAPLKDYLQQRPELVDGYNAVVDALASFRVAHINLAATYLGKHSLSSGTGRSMFQTYLRANLTETRAGTA